MGADLSLEATEFWRGRLRVWQPKRKFGYRFNLDPVLLAGFCPPARRVCDLGAGCGIIGLLLLASRRVQQVWAVERQPTLWQAARANILSNGMGRRMSVQLADLREVQLPRCDLVVFNPPYFRHGHGACSPQAGRSQARHDGAGTLQEFATAALRSVTARGQVAAVIPVGRAAELCEAMARGNMVVRRQVLILPRRAQPAQRVLLAFARRSRGTPKLNSGRQRPWAVHPEQGAERFASALRPWIEQGRWRA